MSMRSLRRAVVVALPLVVACRAAAPRPLTAGEALRPCPSTPNCVSTEAADAGHAMPPIAFEGSAAGAHLRARAALLAEPRTRIVEERPGYLRAEARTRIMRFVDDVEVVVDSAAGRVRFRSASRVGHGDLGANRARMRRFVQRFGSQ